MTKALLGRLHFYRGVLGQDYGAIARAHADSFRLLRNALEPYVGELVGKTVLDVGCGRLYPYSLLLSSTGNTAYGIDSAYVGFDDHFPRRYWEDLRGNGLESLGRAVMFDLLGQRRTYYRALQTYCGFPLKWTGVNIRRAYADRTGLPDGFFDLAISILCFEHVEDVPSAVHELHRVLKPRSYAYVKIDLFSSRSGGHQIGRQLDIAPPWDHLRENRYPSPVFLNKLRLGEYVAILRHDFDIVDQIVEVDEQGRRLLTPDVRAELAGFTEEELLTSTITIVVRRPE